MSLQIYLSDESASLAFAAKLATVCRQHLTIESKGLSLFLSGTLGAGKTTLSRGMLRALGHSAAVKSPTYTLVEAYELDEFWLYHFDLYRLADAEELEYMGIRDYFDGNSLRLIEWAERGIGVLPEADLELELLVQAPGRAVTISANSAVGRQLLQVLRA